VYHNDFNAVMTGAILGQASFPRTDTLSVFDRLKITCPAVDLENFLSKQVYTAQNTNIVYIYDLYMKLCII